MERYDAVVVGGGPAGSMAARRLAEGGAKTLLLEKRSEFGQVVQCAEGISHQSLTLYFKADPRFIASTINSARFYAPDGRFFTIHKERVGYVLERKIFDRYVAQTAAEAGAELLIKANFTRLKRQNGLWRIFFIYGGKEEVVEARLVIGADGPGSSVGKQAGLKLDIGPEDYHYALEYFMVHPAVEDGRIDFFVGDWCCWKGYGWSFPKGGHYGNVGVGVAIPPKGVSPRQYLENFVSRYFKGAKMLGFTSSVVPVGGHRLRIYSDAIMVVGDAARLAEPISGGGIPAALVSGSVAGEVGAKALAEGDLSAKRLKEYHDRFWKIMNRGEYELAYEIRRAFLKMNDQDLIYLFERLSPLFDGKEIDEIDAFKWARYIFTRSPDLLLFAARKMGSAFVDYLKRTVGL
ncbi:MAG: NAD(P)/FAD-dependent oxidoreductase [Thermotogae bacterium]|nr:NAD(P)/FAD-dependent oxidoreductase [Thermotogota bacterium]